MTPFGFIEDVRNQKPIIGIRPSLPLIKRPINRYRTQYDRGACANEFLHGWLAVAAVFEHVDRDNPINRVHKPIFTHANALVQGPLDDLIMAGGSGGQHLNDPVRRTAATAIIEFGLVADHADIRLNDGVDVAIGLIGVWQAHIKWSDVGLAGRTFQSICDLPVHFTNNFLVPARWRRAHGIGDAVNQLVARTV